MNDSEPQQYTYWTFTCAESSEARGRKFSSIPPCGWCNIRKTTIDLTKKRQIQANCARCARRPRIDPSNAKKHANLTEAMYYADAQNKLKRLI